MNFQVFGLIYQTESKQIYSQVHKIIYIRNVVLTKIQLIGQNLCILQELQSLWKCICKETH